MTPLMMAALKGHACLVSLLVENGAELDKRETRNEFTALCYACSSGNTGCVQALISYGADTDTRTIDGKTLSDLALPHPQIVSHLESLGLFEAPSTESLPNVLPSNLAQSLTKPPSGQENQTPVATPLVQPHQPTELQLSRVNGDMRDTTTQPVQNTTPLSSASGDGMLADSASVVHTFGDMEMFLHGLQLQSLLPSFEKNHITFEHLLNITDTELVQVGVESVGHRKLLLDSIHAVHKKDWQTSSIPAFDKVKSRQQLSCAEVTSMTANLASHSAYMSASLRYMKDQIANDRSLLQADKNGRGLHALRKFVHELQENSRKQEQASARLRDTINAVLDSGYHETADLITRSTTERRGNRAIFYGTGLVALALVSLGAYCLTKTRCTAIPQWLAQLLPTQDN